MKLARRHFSWKRLVGVFVFCHFNSWTVYRYVSQRGPFLSGRLLGDAPLVFVLDDRGAARTADRAFLAGLHGLHTAFRLFAF